MAAKQGANAPLLGGPYASSSSTLHSASSASTRSYHNPHFSPGERRAWVPSRDSKHYHRLKYFERLEREKAQRDYEHSPGRPSFSPPGSPSWGSPGSPGGSSRSFLPPPGLLPSYLFVVGREGPSSGEGVRSRSKAPRQQSRCATIFSIVNTMMGSTIMALPWGFYVSGLVGASIIVVVACAVSFFTAALVIHHGRRDLDFQRMTERTLGVTIRRSSGFVNVLVMIGAAVAYHILMKDGLHSIGTAILEWMAVDHHRPRHGGGPSNHTHGGGGGGEGNTMLDLWNQNPGIAALAVLVLSFPLANLKRITVLVRFNSIGILFLFFNITFIIVQGVTEIGPDTTVSSEDLFIKPGFASLAGMILLAFFIHNAVHPIMRHSNPKTRLCDLSIAYSLVGLLYLVVGIAGFFAMPRFQSTGCYPDASKPSCQNFLAMFKPSQPYAFAANCALFLQLFTVFPILLMIVRSETFGLFDKAAYPGVFHVLGANLGIFIVTTSFAIFYPYVGEVLRFTGAGGGLVIMFLIPCGIDLLQTFSPPGGDKTEAKKIPDAMASNGSRQLSKRLDTLENGQPKAPRSTSPLALPSASAPSLPTSYGSSNIAKGGASMSNIIDSSSSVESYVDTGSRVVASGEATPWQRRQRQRRLHPGRCQRRCFRGVVDLIVVAGAIAVLALQFV